MWPTPLPKKSGVFLLFLYKNRTILGHMSKIGTVFYLLKLYTLPSLYQ